MTEWRCDGWRVTGDEATSDEWRSDEWRVTKRRVTSDEVMECLEMAEVAETLVEGLGGMEWDLD